MNNQSQSDDTIAASDPEVAVTGSPNSVTDVNFDVRATHLRNPLLGTLLNLRVPVQGAEGTEALLVMGQVSRIETRNRWHEDPSLKNYIKLHGRLPHLTEIGDNSCGVLQILGAYRNVGDNSERRFNKTRLSVPPGSGLPISLVDAGIIRDIMCGEFGYAYLGDFYGSNNVPAPVYVRHFGDSQASGSGEAYMGGVFGPSGSGKSVIAASLIALWAHNPQMGILILDPQSEFSENALARGTSFDFDFHSLLNQLSGGKFTADNDVIRLDQLQLEGVEVFVQILVEKGFFQRLGLGAGKIAEASENVQRFLETLKERAVWDPTLNWNAVNQLQILRNQNPQQTGQTGQDPFSVLFVQEAASAYAASSRNTNIQNLSQQWNLQTASLGTIWDETVALFKDRSPDNRQRVNLRVLLEGTILQGKIKILDLNPVAINMSSRFKLYLMDFVFRKLRQISHIHYRQNHPGNCLIVLDEAGRYIPQDTGGDEVLGSLCKKLTDSVKEMRKMRCGFMFITQTIAEIQKEIFRNLHFRIYGVGLGVGVDADHIRSREGDEAYELYRSLPDPRLSGTFSFMVSGVLLAVGSSGRPMVIEGFPSGTALLGANAHIMQANSLPSLGSIGQIVGPS